MAAPQLGGLHINFTINPSDILTMNGIVILVGGFVIFLLLGILLRRGIAVSVILIVFTIALYFVSGITPSFTSFGSQLFSMVSVYVPSLITLATGMLPLSGVTAALGFVAGFIGFSSESPVNP